MEPAVCRQGVPVFFSPCHHSPWLHCSHAHPALPRCSLLTKSECVQVYQDLCSQDGLSLRDPSPHGIREYSLSLMPGTYRRLLVRPADLSWQLLQYSDADTPLAVTALDRECTGSQGGEGKLACSTVEPGDCPLQGPG